MINLVEFFVFASCLIETT